MNKRRHCTFLITVLAFSSPVMGQSGDTSLSSLFKTVAHGRGAFDRTFVYHQAVHGRGNDAIVLDASFHGRSDRAARENVTAIRRMTPLLALVLRFK
jgi:hypothetical protein